MRGEKPEKVLSVLKKALSDILSYEGEVFGASRTECGNYKELDLASAKKECERYLAVLNGKENDFKYAEACFTVGVIAAMKMEAEVSFRYDGYNREGNKRHTFLYGKALRNKRVTARMRNREGVCRRLRADMILEYAPDLIINTGVAGTLTEKLSIGDIIIADKAGSA